ncbi:hypothetical protein KRP22_003119 [Phytophthora ramorum]|nr:putative 2-oxoglutarate-dependent dioxygenase DIN11 [Phytophthora ramorum]
MLVPVIDISPFVKVGDPSTCKAARDQVVAQVSDACRNVGFLVITNHGIPSETIAAAFEAARDYFDQPSDVKKQVAMTSEYPYGYESAEILSNSLEKDDGKALPDLKETFQVCVGPEGREPTLPAQWPTGPKAFKDTMTTYYRSVEKLAAVMMKIFACALQLPSDFFDKKIDNHMSSLRILNYPHQEQEPGTEQIRASAHTDYGSLTILAVDDAPGGLQVCDLQGEWHSVKAPANSENGTVHFSLDREVNGIGATELGPITTRVTFSGSEGASLQLDSTFAVKPKDVTDIALINVNVSAAVGRLPTILPAGATRLHLENTLLTKFPTVPLFSLWSLTYLNLDSNHIERINSSAYSASLESLSLQSNGMHVFQGYFPQLQTLVLSHNRFSVIPEGIFHLHHLKTLRMTGNPPLSRNFTAPQADFLRKLIWDLNDKDFAARRMVEKISTSNLAEQQWSENCTSTKVMLVRATTQELYLPAALSVLRSLYW